MKYFIVSCFAIVTISCTSDHNASADERKVEYAEYIDNQTTMTYEADEFDFGIVIDGEKVKHTYKFTNTGDQNLILIDVKGTCGCTALEDWPKYPIAPGESGEIKIVFDSKERVGNVRKNVRVDANTNPSTKHLVLTGIVKAK